MSRVRFAAFGALDTGFAAARSCRMVLKTLMGQRLLLDSECAFGSAEGSLEVPGTTALLPFERCALGRAELVEEVWWLSLFWS